MLIPYANDESKQGTWLAKAVLKLVYDTLEMNYPNLEPQIYGARTSHNSGNGSQTNDPGALPAMSYVNNDLVTNSTKFAIYPNPSAGSVKLYFPDAKNTELNYELRDIVGKMVQSGKLKTNVTQELEGKNLQNGIYFVILTEDGKVVAEQKLVILK